VTKESCSNNERKAACNKCIYRMSRIRSSQPAVPLCIYPRNMQVRKKIKHRFTQPCRQSKSQNNNKMKKTITYIITICAVSSLLLTGSATLTSCGEPIPPNPDQDSINRANSSYINYYINGEYWEDCSKLGQGTPYSSGWYPDRLEIYGQDYCSEISSEIALRIQNFSGIGKYHLNDYSVATIGKFSSESQFTTTDSYTGNLDIDSIDELGRYLYGSFSFKCYNSNLDSVISITDGRINKIRYTKF